MPYPDNFSGAAFDRRYGTEDDEPDAEHLAWLDRHVARLKHEADVARIAKETRK